MYGEKAAFLQELYLLAKARNGVLNYLEPENTERNLTYVGEWRAEPSAWGATSFSHRGFYTSA